MRANKQLKGKKILVTGGDGFIGRALVDRLRAYGAAVEGWIKAGLSMS
jgi:nucleoside-diphosphate-sugar epimerase